MQQDTKTRDVYALATNRIIELLEQGTVPWQKPWTTELPQNLITKRPYRGINVWLLASLDYPRNLFLTFNQLKDIGGSVTKGEKGHLVLFWKWNKPKADDTEPTKPPTLRYYLVFNIDQCTGIPAGHIPEVSAPHEPLARCEQILHEMHQSPSIVTGGTASYHPPTDMITMPGMDTFVSSEAYYATLFHELVHSTGHSSRLNRREITEQPSVHDYSLEELTAEMGASYLASLTGIVVDDYANNAAYIASWLKVFKGDKRFVISASAQAQRAVEYILGTNKAEPVVTDTQTTTV
jgi:antirestriction protein ArdC